MNSSSLSLKEHCSCPSHLEGGGGGNKFHFVKRQNLKLQLIIPADDKEYT